MRIEAEVGVCPTQASQDREASTNNACDMTTNFSIEKRHLSHTLLSYTTRLWLGARHEIP